MNADKQEFGFIRVHLRSSAAISFGFFGGVRRNIHERRSNRERGTDGCWQGP
jgi:hypothetical protein